MKKNRNSVFFSFLNFFKIRDIVIACSAYVRKKAMYNFFVNKFRDSLNKNILTKEQKQEIDVFYKKFYGKKVDYKWHNLFTMYSGNFDAKYIPFDVFLKFTDIMNSKKNYYEVLKDKNFLYLCANFAGVKAPKRLFGSINGIFFDSDNNIISKEEFYEKMSNTGEVFIKPSAFDNTGFAKNCRTVKLINGIDIYSKSSIKDIIENFYDKNFIVQEKITCHKSISDIYSKSVNTFAVSSLIWNNQIKIINCVFKIGRGNCFVDWDGLNGRSLEIGIKNDGTLFDYALCIGEKKKYYAHPDTGVVFKNYKIELFPKIRETVIKLHSTIPWLKFCNWDITLDYNGNPVVIETEKPVGIDPQLSLGKSCFGDYTEEILTFLKNNDRR